MGPNVFIHDRYATGARTVPTAMQYVTLDIGGERSLAKIRLPIPAEEGQEPEIEWCRRQLGSLVTRWKDGESLAPAELEMENGATLEAVVGELERAVSAPDGISASSRGK